MLNKTQKATILYYIDQFKPGVKKSLRDRRMLNNNGTLMSWDNHKGIVSWFLNSIEIYGYEVYDGTIYLEISDFDTHSGNPFLFDFPVEELPY